MIVTALIALSHALIAQRKYPDAEACLQEALERIEKHPRPRYRWFKGEIQSRLGEAVAAQGKPQEAEKLLAAGYPLRRERTFYGRRLITHEIPAERAIDVDEPYHLKLAELLDAARPAR